jgi:predicted NodU family carbamoyl transferase
VVVAVAAAPAEAGPRALTARSKLDARECLKQETNQAIHRCAEGFR